MEEERYLGILRAYECWRIQSHVESHTGAFASPSFGPKKQESEKKGDDEPEKEKEEEATASAQTKEEDDMLVLGLHGYMQSGQHMRKRLRRLLGSLAPADGLLCPDGPHPADGGGGRGWWALPSKETFCVPHRYEGYDRALEEVRALPLDRVGLVVGFSQGAVFATLLLAQGLLPRARCAVLASGSDIMDFDLLPAAIVDVPSVHLLGTKDDLCVERHSLALSRRYAGPRLMRHRYGHVMPSDGFTARTLRPLVVAELRRPPDVRERKAAPGAEKSDGASSGRSDRTGLE